jgi:hypothetical protein
VKEGGNPEEFGPLPRDVQKLMDDRHETRKKDQVELKDRWRYHERVRFITRREWLREWMEYLAASAGADCADTNTQLELASYQFTNLVNEGAASAHHGGWLGQNGAKRAYAEVGYANPTGSAARAWNRSVFGFVSSFQLPGPGQSSTVRIGSHMHADFTFPDGVDTLLHGVSPRGNWNEGEIGVYNPTAESRDVDHEVEFTATNPVNGQLLVTVFELAEFIAERHHNAARCNAVVWGTCTWSPTDVLITTHC